MPLSRFRLYASALLIGPLLGVALFASPGFSAPGAGGLASPPGKPSLDSQINNASNQLEIVVEHYDSIRVTLAGTQAQARLGQSKLVGLRRAALAAHAKVAAIAANVYRQSTPAATFGQLLMSPDAATLVDRLGMINHIAQMQSRQVAGLNAAATLYAAQNHQLGVLESAQTSEYGVLAAQRNAILAQIATLKALRTANHLRNAPPVPSVSHAPKPHVTSQRGHHGGTSGRTGGGIAPSHFAGSGNGGKAVRFAYAQLGKSYRFGASGPSQYDCSGLTMTAWRAAGVGLPHSAAQQYGHVRHLDRTELIPGDLVFYYHPIHHVGIYVGGGKVIHAPTYGEPVQVASVGLAPIAGYGRP